MPALTTPNIGTIGSGGAGLTSRGSCERGERGVADERALMGRISSSLKAEAGRGRFESASTGIGAKALARCRDMPPGCVCTVSCGNVCLLSRRSAGSADADCRDMCALPCFGELGLEVVMKGATVLISWIGPGALTGALTTDKRESARPLALVSSDSGPVGMDSWPALDSL